MAWMMLALVVVASIVAACALWFIVLRHPVRLDELGAVSPDAVQDDGDLARNSHFRLFGANALHQPCSPCLERGPALGPVQQHAGGARASTPATRVRRGM